MFWKLVELMSLSQSTYTTNGNAYIWLRIRVAALTIHKGHLVSMDCSYVLQVRLRDLRIGVYTYAMLMDIPSRLLVPPTMTRRGRLGMVPWGRLCKRQPRSTCSTTYPLRRSRPDHRGLSDAISYPIKGDDDGPVEVATLADLSGSIRCDRRPDREADECAIVATRPRHRDVSDADRKTHQGLTDVK